MLRSNTGIDTDVLQTIHQFFFTHGIQLRTIHTLIPVLIDSKCLGNTACCHLVIPGNHYRNDTGTLTVFNSGPAFLTRRIH